MYICLASGPYYCSGNDLKTFATIKTREDLKNVSEQGAVILEEFVSSFIEHDKPIIALIHGPAIGISVTTLALCDVILASDKVCCHFCLRIIAVVSIFRQHSKLHSRRLATHRRDAVLTPFRRLWATQRLVHYLIFFEMFIN